jgi:hypothetical protein
VKRRLSVESELPSNSASALDLFVWTRCRKQAWTERGGYALRELETTQLRGAYDRSEPADCDGRAWFWWVAVVVKPGRDASLVASHEREQRDFASRCQRAGGREGVRALARTRAGARAGVPSVARAGVSSVQHAGKLANRLVTSCCLSAPLAGYSQQLDLAHQHSS